MNIKGQGHSLIFVQCHSYSTFSNIFIKKQKQTNKKKKKKKQQKNTRPIEAIFHVEPSWDKRMKVNTNGLCHMTKMAAMPIYSIYILTNFQNLLFWNWKADELETWYAASSSRVLPSVFKWCPWVDTDLFYDKVKFGPLCFCMGRS